MDLVPSVSCESVLSFLDLMVEKPSFHADTIVIQVLLHCEEAVQTTFLQLINLVKVLDAALLCVNAAIHFSNSVVSST